MNLDNQPTDENLDSKKIERPTPVDREVVWDKTKTIMSKTDLFGTIEYANDIFVEVSGYEDYELMAQPHNIIRHPDMPKVVFKVMWENIKQGNQFHGIVKNMSKSGRYYWVITNFEYDKDDNGNIISYIARRRAVPQDVITNHIQPFYNKLLQIEKASGVEASEKYLKGFLQEEGASYVDFITNVMIESEKLNQKTEETAETSPVEKSQKKGFFERFFS